MIEKIGEQYQDCVDNRDKKIAEYKKKLEDQRDAEKKRMEEDMKEVSDLNPHFTEMLIVFLKNRGQWA